jgi:hypothetical protein
MAAGIGEQTEPSSGVVFEERQTKESSFSSSSTSTSHAAIPYLDSSSSSSSSHADGRRGSPTTAGDDESRRDRRSALFSEILRIPSVPETLDDEVIVEDGEDRMETASHKMSSNLMEEVFQFGIIPSMIEAKEALISEIRLGQIELQNQVLQPDGKVSGASHQDADFLEERLHALDRMMLSFDGASSTIKAVTLQHMHEHCERLRIDLFKFAAACSLVQQANDVGRMHMLLKRLFGSYEYASATTWRVPTCFEGFDETLYSCGLDRPSANTYWKAMCHLPDFLMKAGSPSNVLSSFVSAGTVPHNDARILSGCSLWYDFDDATRQEILHILATDEELRHLGNNQGWVSDSDINKYFGHLIEFDDDLEKADDINTINKRCIWLTNRGFHESLMMESDDQYMEEEEKERTRNLAREAKAHKDALEIIRQAEIERRIAAGDIRPRLINVKCGNALSCANKCYKNSSEHETWFKCVEKGCNLALCYSCLPFVNDHMQRVHHDIRLGAAAAEEIEAL